MTKVIVRATENYMCIKNWAAKFALQIGAASFYYKLGQTLLQIGPASLLQIRAKCITNWGRCYNLEKLLQVGA